MKKIIKYAVIILSVVTLVACSNGGGCVSCSIITATIIAPPNPSFQPSGSIESATGQNGTTNPNYISESYNQIAVPDASSANTSYIVYNLPTVLAESLQQAAAQGGGSSSINMSTLVSPSGDQIVLISTPGSTASSPPNVYIVVPPGQPVPDYLISGGEYSTQDYVLIFPINPASYESSTTGGGGYAGNSYGFIVPFPINTNIIPAFIGGYSTQNVLKNAKLDSLTAPISESSFQLPVNLASCSANTSDFTTSVAQTIYNSKYYIAAGTSDGNVCIVDASAFLTGDPAMINQFVNNFSSTGWTANLAKGYTTRYNPRGPVLNMSFPAQSSNDILGFWNIDTTKATNANTVYRITGQGNNQSSTGFVPTSFWNVTISSKQYSPGTGSSMTFNNSPTNAFSMLTDASLNLFVGTKNGSVYKLAYGTSTWVATSLSTSDGTVTGPVSLNPTTNPNGNGVIATGYVTNQTTQQKTLAAFTIQ